MTARPTPVARPGRRSGLWPLGASSPRRLDRRDRDDHEIEAASREIQRRVDEPSVEQRAQRNDQRLRRQLLGGQEFELLDGVAEIDRSREQCLDQAFPLAVTGSRLQPAQIAAVLDKPEAVLARKISTGE